LLDLYVIFVPRIYKIGKLVVQVTTEYVGDVFLRRSIGDSR